MAERRFCGACNDTGVNEQGKRCVCLTNCSERLVKDISQRDPTFAEKIRIVFQEKGYDAYEFCTAMIAWMLENDKQMHAPKHPAFNPQHELTPTEIRCVECGSEFKTRWPGQRLCMPCSQIPPKARHAPLPDTPLPEPIAQSELADDIA